MDTLIAWIMRAIPFGTIIMYGAMGEIITEKSGNLNLGVPGIMYLGGFAGFASAYVYENTAANPNMVLCVVIALICAFVASMLGGLIYSFLTISLRANQNVTGLALTTFGMGVANFFGVYILNGRTATQSMVYKTFQTKLPLLPQLGIIGQTVFNYGFMVYAAIIVAWLAKFNTFTMALISFLLIFLEKGAAEIASAYNLNDFASDIIAGVILFFILGSEFFINYKAIFRGHAGKEVC